MYFKIKYSLENGNIKEKIIIKEIKYAGSFKKLMKILKNIKNRIYAMKKTI